MSDRGEIDRQNLSNEQFCSRRKFSHFSPLHQSAIENDTNEGSNLYLSSKRCLLCKFSISKSYDIHLGLSYSIFLRPLL